jgi:NAD(P)H dehydrogenase (quinone)
MARFLGQAGSIWATGALSDKFRAAFTSSASQHSGNETTLFWAITNLMHIGIAILSLPFSHIGKMTSQEIVGGSPYGSTTLAGGESTSMPMKLEFFRAKHQGKLVVRIAARLID